MPSKNFQVLNPFVVTASKKITLNIQRFEIGNLHMLEVDYI